MEQDAELLSSACVAEKETESRYRGWSLVIALCCDCGRSDRPKPQL